MSSKQAVKLQGHRSPKAGFKRLGMESETIHLLLKAGPSSKAPGIDYMGAWGKQS